MTTQPTALYLADVLDHDTESAAHHKAAAAELRRLHAENEALRADAERYRWMKQEVKRIPPGWELIGWDAAIDAARGKP